MKDTIIVDERLIEVHNAVTKTIEQVIGEYVDLRLKTRKQYYVWGRAIFYHYCLSKKYGSLSKLARFYDQDHATVIHGRKSAETWLSPPVLKDFKYIYDLAMAKISNPDIVIAVELIFNGMIHSFNQAGEYLQYYSGKYTPAMAERHKNAEYSIEHKLFTP